MNNAISVSTTVARVPEIIYRRKSPQLNLLRLFTLISFNFRLALWNLHMYIITYYKLEIITSF